MKRMQRIVFGTGQRGGHHLLPEVLEVGWGRFEIAERGHLRPHCHPGAFECCMILSGEVEWSAAGSSDILRERDVYLTQPDEMHWGRDTAMHPCTLHWLILGSPDCGYSWPDLDAGLVAHLVERLRLIRTHRLRGTGKMREAFQELFDEHAAQPDSGARLVLRQANARAALHRLLIELVRTYERQCVDESAARGYRELPLATAHAIEILSRNAHEPDVIRRVCRLTNTPYRKLNRQFVEHLGATISQYWLRERVRLARTRLLLPNTSITDVAAELSFSSSQHFATLFRRITGLTPSQYRHIGRLDDSRKSRVH